MTVLDLVKRLGGSVLANKARVTVNGNSVVVGRLLGVDWVWTPEGQALAGSLPAPTPAPAPAPVAETDSEPIPVVPAERTRKTR